jgi:hypothetical protein
MDIFEIADRAIGAEDNLGFTHSLNHVHVERRKPV